MAYSGKFSPKHPSKYIGDPTDIFWRSMWELRCMRKFDETGSIIKWSSETIIIPYYDPTTKVFRRYFPDFYIKYSTKNNTIKEAIIEVKPFKECKEPVQGKKKTRRFLNEVILWSKNSAKWSAAKTLCEQKGWTFMLWNEKNCKF